MVVDVAPDHLDRPFDYLIPDGETAEVGQLVRVTFAGRRRDGWVVGLADEPEADPAKVRPLLALRETEFAQDDLRLYRWVADRYAAPLAAVLRQVAPPRVAGVERETHPRAPAPPASRADGDGDGDRSGGPWGAYGAAGLLEALAEGGAGAYWLRPLPGHDPAALAADLAARALGAGRGVVGLAPDPASGLFDALLARAGPHGADWRGDERERYRAFVRGRRGSAWVAVGERGAVFAPVRDLGLIVVEDEANPAFKGRRSPRHHARDVALARAAFAGAVCVVVSDLPSARLWRLVSDGHVRVVAADRATERAQAPRVDVVDLADPRPGTRRARLHETAARAVSAAVRAGGAAVVLASRRGEGVALACKACGRRRSCPVCDGSLRPETDGWGCSACGWTGASFACRECAATETSPLAAGAGRFAAELAKSHPEAEVVAMEGFDAAGPSRRPAIAVMTRGSVVDRPAWLAGQRAAALVVPDADALLGRPSVAAGEDTLRLLFAAARWADRLVVQTREPGNPAVQALVRWDAEGFWRSEVERRAVLRYPPLAHLIRVAAPPDGAREVAAELRRALPAEAELLGPDPQGAMLVKTDALRPVLEALAPLRAAWARAHRKVRVDVDPDPID